MDERVLQFRIGVMVVGTVFIAAFLVLAFNYDPALLRGRYTIYVKFPEAPGIETDTPVYKSGVLVGRVSDVLLREDDVLVTLKIDAKYKIRADEVCQIGTESLLGDSMIEFVPGPAGAKVLPAGAPGPAGAAGEPLTEGALIEGQVKGDPLRSLEVLAELEVEVKTAMAQFSLASQRVGQLADNVNALVVNNEEQITRIVAKSELAMDEFQRAMSNINELVGDEQVRADLKASLAGVPQLIDDTRTAVQKYGAVADQAEASLLEAQKFAGTLNQLGESSQRMSGNVDQITEKLDRLILDLLTVSDAINKQEGTIGQLVYNPDLYQRLNRAAGNVEELTRRMRPIVEDVRVFSDKIARDPGRLGVRGVLQNNDGTKFLPMSFFNQGGQPMPAYPSHVAPYGTQFAPSSPPPYCPPEMLPPLEATPEYELPPTAARSTTPQAFWQTRR